MRRTSAHHASPSRSRKSIRRRRPSGTPRQPWPLATCALDVLFGALLPAAEGQHRIASHPPHHVLLIAIVRSARRNRYCTINPQFTAFSHSLPFAFNRPSCQQVIVRFVGHRADRGGTMSALQVMIDGFLTAAEL